MNPASSGTSPITVFECRYPGLEQDAWRYTFTFHPSGCFSMALRTSSCVTCKYISVVLTCSWPAISFKVTRSTPTCSSKVRQVWRSLCTNRPGRDNPAFTQIRSKSFCTPRRDMARPSLFKKTALSRSETGRHTFKYSSSARHVFSVKRTCRSLLPLPIKRTERPFKSSRVDPGLKVRRYGSPFAKKSGT